MIQIGYIYHYSPEEGVGILAVSEYYLEQEKAVRHPYHSPKQILFQKEDVLSPIKVGTLVYYEYISDKKVSIISEANLKNFNIELLNALTKKYEEIPSYENDGLTRISFRDLSSGYKETDIFDMFDNWTDFDDEEDSEYSNDILECEEESDISSQETCIIENNDESTDLESKDSETKITDIYNELVYGKHAYKYSQINIDILDIENWYVRLNKHNNLTFEEVKYLYDIFIKRGNERPQDSIHLQLSNKWKLIISRLPQEEQKRILTEIPDLQPAVSEECCINNLEKLSFSFKLPSKKVAIKLLNHKFNNVLTVEQYLNLDLFLKRARQSKKFKEKGSLGFSLSDLYWKELNAYDIELAIKLENLVIPLVKKLWNLATINNSNRINELINDNKYIIDLGLFLEIIMDEQFAFHDKYMCDDVYELFNNIRPTDQQILYPVYSKVVNNAFIKFGERQYYSYKGLTTSVLLHSFKGVFTSETIRGFKEVSAITWEEISEFEELRQVLEDNILSEELTHRLIQKLTANLNLYKLAKFITTSDHDNGFINFADLPVKCQEFILNRLLDKYNEEKLKDRIYIRITEYNGFYSFESFILWLTELKSGQYGRINIPAIEKVISRATEHLTKEEMDYFYEKGYLVKNNKEIKTILNMQVDQLMSDMEYQRYKDSLFEDDNIGRYTSSYAHDEAGYSDDDIDTIFDGDPDAYWNID